MPPTDQLTHAIPRMKRRRTDGLQPLVQGLHDLEEDGRLEGQDGGDVVAEEHLEEGEVGLGELLLLLGGKGERDR